MAHEPGGKPSQSPLRRHCRRWRRVTPAIMSSSARVRPPRPWRTGLQLLLAEETYPSSWVPGSGAALPPPSIASWAWRTGLGRSGPSSGRQERGDGGLRSRQTSSSCRWRKRSTKSERCPRTACSSRSPAPSASVWGGNLMTHSIDNPSDSDRNGPEHPALLQPRRSGHPDDRVPQGLLAALQMVRQSREHRAEAGTGLRPQNVHRQGECGVCLKAPFPEGAFYVVDGATTRSRSTGTWPPDCDEEMVALCPTGRARHVREADDRGRSAGRGGEGCSFYRNYRRRHDPEWWRMPAAAGLQCRVARGSARARYQHGDRDRGQRAVEVLGAGAAPRRHDAPRPQADELGASQEVDRCRQRATSRELQEGVRDVSRRGFHRPHAADSRDQRRRGADSGRARVHTPAQERDRLSSCCPITASVWASTSCSARSTSWTTSRRRPTT